MVYFTPRFRNRIPIQLLTNFSSEPGHKYLTSGTQKRFVTAPGSCIDYQNHRVFSAYLSDAGKFSVIAEKYEAIESLITKHFHLPLSMKKDPPLHIYPFNIVEKRTRSASDKQPAFLQCGRRSKFRSIFGLILPDLCNNSSNMQPHTTLLICKTARNGSGRPFIMSADYICNI